MKSLANWSIKNNVTVNLILVFVVTAGLLTVMKMRREMFPQFQLDMVNVSVEFPGASPEEVEEGICIKVEEKIKGVEGVSKIISHAYEGRGSITVEVESNQDVKRALDDIKTEVDRIDTFPEEAEEPVIVEIINRNPAITVAVYGDVPEKLLRKIAEQVRDDLVDTEPISLAQLVGVREYEISIEISEEDLRRYGLTFDKIAQAVKSGSVDLGGGTIKTASGEILVRSKGQRYTGREFEAIPLITRPDGTTITLGMIARVIDGFEDVDIKARFNGKPSALVQVNRTSQEDIIAITRTVKQYVESRQSRLPEGVNLATWYDISILVQDRIDLLLRNGAQGIFLVFLGLALFLNLRLAFWVAIGIPVSFMGAFCVLGYVDATINMISLFAFIMTLGILVDDAIIVGENVFSQFGRGKSPYDAVVDGFAEVAGPVTMAVTTTVVAFLPLMGISGIIGKFIRVMPQAVIAILIVSLGEALVILPSHLHHALSGSIKPQGKWLSRHERIRERVERGLKQFIENIYTPLIGFVVKNRYFTFSIGLGVLIISVGLIMGGYVQFVFFPKGESNWIIAELNYPLGTPYTTTEKTIQYLENKAFELNEIFAAGEETDRLVQNSFALVGTIPRRDWKLGETGSHVGEVWLELISSEHRKHLSAQTVLNKWRSLVGDIPGIDRLAFNTLEGGPGGNPIEIKLTGKDIDRLRIAADELKAEIATYPGTFDITDNFKPGKVEYQIKIRDDARALGVTMGMVARQVRQAYYGEEAVRIQRGKDDVKVMVRYDESDRRRVSSLEELRIRTLDGREIPFEEVAHITPGRAYSVIHRIDRKREITVISNLDELVGNATQIVADLNASFIPELLTRYPGIGYNLEGQEKRTRESFDSLKKGFTLALMGIYLLLATQFRSYTQPVVVMMAIPFGLIGAIVGHLVMGLQFTMISIFGLVALSGIVVNDSLILIDFINRADRSGLDIESAVIESGRARFRPVLLTSVTTIAGLLPLLLERSFQAQFLIPMAVSISFGLLAATCLTLLYVPALYLIVKDIRQFVKKIFSRRPSDEFGK